MPASGAATAAAIVAGASAAGAAAAAIAAAGYGRTGLREGRKLADGGGKEPGRARAGLADFGGMSCCYNGATCWFANLAECVEGRCQPQGDGWRRRALVALHHIHRVEGPPGAVTNL
jgi:hypothetical protein